MNYEDAVSRLRGLTGQPVGVLLSVPASGEHTVASLFGTLGLPFDPADTGTENAESDQLFFPLEEDPASGFLLDSDSFLAAVEIGEGAVEIHLRMYRIFVESAGER